jgi:hypothetical protein
MSATQLELELPTLDATELDALEAALRREKLRRSGRVLSAEETRLYSIINESLPGEDDLRALRLKLDERTLTEEEQARLVALENEREVAWARKLRAVSELADLRGEEFEALYQRLGLNLRVEG